MDSFRERRQAFYKKIPDFWHDLYDTEYALFDIKIETSETIRRIRQATEHIGHIYFKTAPLLRKLDNETLLSLGLPPETHNYIRQKTLPFESIIARLDLVVADNEVKLLEMNADTPTFIKETFFVNDKVCQAFGMQNPNAGCEKQLQEAVSKAVTFAFDSKKGRKPNVVFAAHSEHDEDRLTTMYLNDLCKPNSKYSDFQQLRLLSEPIIEEGQVVAESGLYDMDDKKIDVLYRQTYPIEHLIHDEDLVTKEKVGQLLMELVGKKELSIVNPPSAFLIQSKAVMALIWGLHEKHHSFYTQKEHDWIRQHFLPTYLDSDVFLAQNQRYVKKPAFGREGDTVEIISGTGEKIMEDCHKTYADELSVYQQFIELPKTIIQTEQGKKQVHYMYGCFYINGQASAIGIRAGGQITDNASYFLPIGYQVKGENVKNGDYFTC